MRGANPLVRARAATAQSRRPATALLALGALGVVYGDIGTNPLFAMREAFEAHHLPIDEATIIGLLSVIFWALILVITVKYVTFVLRADNDGEGGILALVALLGGRNGQRAWTGRWLLILLGILGAAFLYGDGIITPSISVLAAVEGTEIAAPSLHAVVVPAAVLILVALFLVQHRGTAAVGGMFGPVMLTWFVTIGVLGATQIASHPGVFAAVNPARAISFFATQGTTGFLALGAVILVVVGGEALYADLGHFGRRPIALGWHAIVLPALVLVYFGQGALLLDDPTAIDNPFYRMAPQWALVPLVVLATLATVIASQALITGAYSLTRQAVQLGMTPRINVKHTSETVIGQIYVPAVNWALMVACVALVVGFRTSANLASAYGVAVSATMLITTILFYVVARERMGWPAAQAVPACSLFLVIDVAFFSATLFKIPRGGWLPLVVAIVLFTLLTTWRTGHRIARERLLRRPVPLRRFVESLREHPPVRAPGTGAYLFPTAGITPPVLAASLRHHDSLHEQVLIVSVVVEERPRVQSARRSEIEDLGEGFHQVIVRFGYLEDPDIPRALAGRPSMDLGLDLGSITYFVGRESVRVTPLPGMARWPEHLYALMSRNEADPATYFRLPAGEVFELGVIVEL
jgi:KUP system potassium uptake protein